MKRGKQVSPAAVGIVITVTVAFAILAIFKFTGSPGKVTLSPEQVKKMQAMGHGVPTVGPRGMQVSMPPMSSTGK